MKKTLLASLLIGGSAVTGFALITATAQEGRRGPPAEFRAMMEERAGEKLEELDLNSDGEISREEIEAKEASVYAEMDANGDGAVTAEELGTFHEAKRAEREAKIAEKRAKKHAKMIEKLDENGDGVVSLAEFQAKPNPRFDLADSNDDGVIDQEEWETAMERAGKFKMKRARMLGGQRDFH